jgi:hypothetical protein
MMKVFYSKVCLKHAPKHEIISGNLINYLGKYLIFKFSKNFVINS